MPDIVLDSSAILAILFGEVGAARVKRLEMKAFVSSVNIAEVHTKLILRGVPEKESWREIDRLGYVSVPFDDTLAREAGSLVRIPKPHGLSLGDRACLALAMQRKAKVYTTDEIWAALGLPLQIEVIR